MAKWQYGKLIGARLCAPFFVSSLRSQTHQLTISAAYLLINSQTHLLTNSHPMFVGMAYFAYFCKTKARNGGGSVPLGMLATPIDAANANPELALCPLKNHY